MEPFYTTEYLENELFAEERTLPDGEDSPDEEIAPPGELPSDEEALPDMESLLDGEISREEFDELPALELTLTFEDGTERVCRLAAVFLAEEKEYAALSPLDGEEGEVILMRLFPGEDDALRLAPVEESEWEAVSRAFMQLLPDDTEQDAAADAAGQDDGGQEGIAQGDTAQDWEKESEEDGD